METLTSGKNDDSANSRLDGYRAASEAVKTHPFGRGLGVPEDVFDITGSFSLRDSGIIDMLVTFGWFGAAAYAVALGALLLPLIARACKAKNSTLLSLSFPSIALLCILPLGKHDHSRHRCSHLDVFVSRNGPYLCPNRRVL